MMGKRAVLYARVSGDDRGKDGRNLASQLEMCREYALARGWQVVAELAEDDRGASGASFELPELGRVLQMAEARELDVLAVRELDRLSRNLAKQLVVEEELSRHDVQVEYVLEDYANTPEGRLNKHIRATIAEYEREKIAERMVRGRRNKVKAGNVTVSGRPPYGYIQGENNGKQTLVIHEPEARVVRMIFSWYAYGEGQSGPLGIRSIAHKLTNLKIPTYAQARGTYCQRDSAPWNESVISRMVRNPTYHGEWHYGKRKRNGGGKWESNGGDHLLAVKVPAIIHDELWEAAQAQVGLNRAAGKVRRRYQYLMSCRVSCGHCGIKAVGQTTISKGRSYRYYRCAAALRKGSFVRDCNAPYFRADRVDAVVWQWIKSFLTDPEALKHGLREHQQQREKELAPLRERLTVVDDLLADNRAQLERLLDLYLSGDFPKEVLTDRKARLEKTLSALENERAKLTAHIETQMLSAEQIQGIHAFAARVGENLEAMDDDFESKRTIIETLDVSVILAVEDEKRIVHARCILGEQVCGLRSIPLVV